LHLQLELFPQAPSMWLLYAAAHKCQLLQYQIEFCSTVWIIRSVTMNLLKKAQCMGWFIKTKSDTQVQRRLRTMSRKMPPSWPSIRSWYKQFKEIGNVLHKKDAVCPVVFHENVEGIHEVFFAVHASQFKLKHMSCKCHIQQCSGYYENVWVCMWRSCKWCRQLHQMTG
jgi:hypothetical protein